jgi:hypothetical protein
MPNRHDTTIRSAADLYDLWRELMGPGGFGRRSLWLLFLDGDGRPERVIMPIDDIPARADSRLVDALDSIVASLLDEGIIASAAILLSRPGPSDMTDGDRAWARAVRRRPSFRTWPVHLATHDQVRVFAADDLIGVPGRPLDAA